MNALQFECVKVALKQDRTGYILTLSMHPDEIPEELLRDFVGTRYGCALVRIQDDESPTHYDNRVAQAGMLCKAREFQYFLKSTGKSDDVSEDGAVRAIYTICNIKSRTELNGNVGAKVLFDEMVNEYEQWNKKEPF